MHKLLFVDDEMQILKALNRLFAEKDYNIFLASNSEQALTILDNNAIEMIVTDMRMPGMDGFELLNIVKEKYPNVFRIILSSNSDEHVVLKALRLSIAKLYLYKPWNNEEIVKLIGSIFETESVLKEKNLLTTFNTISELPTIKASHQKIIQMIESDAELLDIASLIETDQSISSKILHIANSAFYGVKTGSVKQSVVFLGLNNLQSIIKYATFFDSMQISKSCRDFIQELWKHAYLTNKLLIYINQNFMHREIPEEYRCAGLLHNIGSVFLLNQFAQKYLALRKKNIQTKNDLPTCEKDAFSISHPEAGGYLLKWWELPYPIVESALYCNDPLNPAIIHTELVCAVHIAQKIASDLIGIYPYCKFEPEAYNVINISAEDLDNGLRKLNLV